MKRYFIVFLFFCIFFLNKTYIFASEENSLIWNIEDTNFYDFDYKIVKKIEAGTPLRIEYVKDKYFCVEYDGQLGFVDSNYCMINLPDYMQKEVKYNITNAYNCIYKIHGYDIEDLSGEILYPTAKKYDEFLVPLLYPVAKKLYIAEQYALSKGYSFVVYDAYRPYIVSQQAYSLTSKFIKENPEYLKMMTEPVNGIYYGQGWFLAQSISNHNYGIAVDLTLYDIQTGEELKMQSPMHELSTKSVLDLNNDNANLLQDIMLSNGFSNLKSEWWHFQINEYKKSYASFQVNVIENEFKDFVFYNDYRRKFLIKPYYNKLNNLIIIL